MFAKYGRPERIGAILTGCSTGLLTEIFSEIALAWKGRVEAICEIL